ncbi:hypothetical protein HispidOSU_022149 [Sigmodon hispidus]
MSQLSEGKSTTTISFLPTLHMLSYHVTVQAPQEWVRVSPLQTLLNKSFSALTLEMSLLAPTVGTQHPGPELGIVCWEDVQLPRELWNRIPGGAARVPASATFVDAFPLGSISK